MRVEVVPVEQYGRKSKGIGDNRIYVYCAKNSAFSNPFASGNGNSTEEQVERFKKESFPYAEVFRLIQYCKAHKITELLLGCYCAGGPCHCDELKAFIDNSIAVLKFKEADIIESKQCTIRLASVTDGTFVAGERLLIVSSDESSVEPASIEEVHLVPFYQLKNAYSRFLPMQHNPKCRTYDSLLLCMSEFYKKDIENMEVLIVRFKMDKFRGLFD